jgi:hypothetical protein
MIDLWVNPNTPLLCLPYLVRIHTVMQYIDLYTHSFFTDHRHVIFFSRLHQHGVTWPRGSCFGMEDLSVAHLPSCFTCHAVVDLYSSIHQVLAGAVVASSSHSAAKHVSLWHIRSSSPCLACRSFWVGMKTESGNERN